MLLVNVSRFAETIDADRAGKDEKSTLRTASAARRANTTRLRAPPGDLKPRKTLDRSGRIPPTQSIVVLCLTSFVLRRAKLVIIIIECQLGVALSVLKMRGTVFEICRKAIETLMSLPRRTSAATGHNKYYDRKSWRSPSFFCRSTCIYEGCDGLCYSP